MPKIKFFLAFCCLISLGFLSVLEASAQKRKSSARKKKPRPVYILKDVRAVISSGAGEREPSLSLEPCAKETPEQISELENAPDKNKQLEILLKRTAETDDWLRACTIYRLGEFGRAASDALPVVLKLFREEKNRNVWRHVEKALWRIPPDPNIPLRKRLELAKNEDVYLRIYGVFSLWYFQVPARTLESKEILNAFIEAAADDELAVRWLAVAGIKQLSAYDNDTSAAIPVLSELLQKRKINPIHAVNAFAAMRVNAFAAAPLLLDVLYEPKKYIGETDEKSRPYILYLSASFALGNIGKPLVPLLEKEFEKQPVDILQVLRHLKADPAATLPIFLKGIRHQNPEVRKKAIESLPTLNAADAIEVVPLLVTAIKDADSEVRKTAISEIATIAEYMKEKPDVLREMFRKQAVPALIANLENEETRCYAAMNLPEFGADAEPVAIPALARLIKKKNGNFCAESALYDFGEKGRKFLTKQQIRYVEEMNRLTYTPSDGRTNKPRTIKPKTERADREPPAKTKGD